MRRALLPLLLIAALGAGAQTAPAAVFEATASGSQELSWTVSGSDSGCEVRTATGSGGTSFKFSSPKASFLTVTPSKKSAKVIGSVNSTAKGTVAGSFSEQTTTACPGFEPQPPRSEDASGCGSVKFGLRLDFRTSGAFVYVTAPNSFLAGSKMITGACPAPLGSSWMSTNDLSSCGDGSKQWQRSWGVSSAYGLGLFATRLTISKNLAKLKKGRSRTITGRATVNCNIASPFSGGVTYNGQLKYALKFTRAG